ncbi:MAG: retropepsin-like aspartic protease family protein [Paracoccus sp. (in: a-proteobacteria)]|jgi:aspartyl protease family protein|uniref:retropepsin-like aspartic protease family protein n=1 Tax=unclassified Paracoccus (in: a-proteobacteria) TaxID=2688777 RepID=UPI000C484383|nr:MULTISPECIES: TIGR02281 family clan AA aspartic protease [unclassified Paracoccus (in: a-proteobacteria)]MAN56326.1 TIGR02281 family clan AA aspartic protease [Paracoccus sp. (in: a-proteobacteria)]MCS5601678.1 TIGR02281 family clan AA aspartic protease [Paracoccus sp. (in: a-proteobacteria)]HIC64495.1 TIGR02281 family clan AA aspartic protease [Paracoccus sp. (in: a-proteobacteria)]|tara:strand:+ start:3204 stop:3773 length:570 start_codon:yes stop_codon:yes gene_type:complete
MAADEGMQLAYYILLLVVIGGAMIFELSGRGGRMLRQTILWAVIFAGASFAAQWWIEGGPAQQQVLEGGRVSIPVGRDGHFQLTARLNGTEVRFLVDTGASTIALSRQDARRIGINPDDLAYAGTAMTANGNVKTAPVTIDTLEIGDIVDRNVRAQVIGGNLQGSLLGMSYLRTFARVSFEGDLLILER